MTEAAEQGGRGDVGQPSTATWVLAVPLRVFLAAGWLRAAAEKVLNTQWWHGRGVRSFLTTEQPLALPFARPVMDSVLQPGAIAVAVIVVVAELLSGLAIATGRGLRVGLWLGVVLNVAFVACGRVNPSAFYLVMEFILLFAIAEGALGRARRMPANPLPAIVSTAAGLALLPFIRTLEPAGVITDPAAMLAFLALILGLGLGMRWASVQPVGTPAQRLAAHVIHWSQAQPPAIPPRIEQAALPFAPPRHHLPHPLLRPVSSTESGLRRQAVRGEGSTAST